MTDHDFRRLALALDGAVEGAHMGHADFRAHGRIFASLRHAPTIVGGLMLTPDQQRAFMERSKSFTPESGAWGEGGWTRVHFDDADAEIVGEALTLAWQNAAAKAAARRATKKRPAVRKRGETR
jgi:hypothetical protein